MSLNFYMPEEDYGKEESVNHYKSLFSSYKNSKPNLSESLYQMYKSENLADKKCNELTKDILDKCKSKIDQKLFEIKKKYKNISKEDAYIICSYTCESKEKAYNPYKILNKNLVSENRKNGVANISKYLYIFLKALRKLPRFYPPKDLNYLYRCITHKVSLSKDIFNDKLIPYKIGEKKTFWGFTSTSTNPKDTYMFLKDEKEFKSGTIFSLEGDIWGYDIEIFNYFNEKEILLEPERKFIVKNVLPPINEIVNITCKIIESPLILLDNEIEDQNNIINNEIENEEYNKNNNGKIDDVDIKYFKNIQKINNPIQQKGKFEQNKSGNLSNIHVIKFLDYSSKYGLGYVLNNGHVGVYFNDGISIIYKPNGTNFIFLEKYSKEKGNIAKEHKFTENFDKDFKKKVILLEHFKAYLLEENKNSPKEKKENENIDNINYAYVRKWIKTKHAILFRLSNKIVQTIFLDHTELLLHSDNKIVNYLDKNGKLSTFPLKTALESGNYEITKRLKYVKQMLEFLLKKNSQVNEH